MREHIRSNVVGYIALFFVFTGGAYALDGSNTVFSDDIKDGEVKTQDINDTNGVRSADVRDDTLESGGLQATDLRPDSVGGSEVAANAVGGSEVLPDSLGADDLAPESVESSELADSGVNGIDIRPNTIGSDKITNGSLTSDDLGTGSVTSNEVATESLFAQDLAPNSVGSSEVADFSLSNKDVGVLFARVNPNGTVASSSGGVTASKPSSNSSYIVDFGRPLAGCAPAATPDDVVYQVGAQLSGDPESVIVNIGDGIGNVFTGGARFNLIVVC
jgi:hypothetical protein